MRDTTPDNLSEVEDFLAQSGIGRAITLDAAAISVRRKFDAEGAVTFIRCAGCLRVRALLARRWQWSDTERIEANLVSEILAFNPYAKIQAIQVRKHGRYVEAEIGIT